ncbi:selenocysteine-specific translation elongation factor [Roseiterribacter gracilis]|uniref:Selenocysteine-specific elongation factor n=1 Tax=Roseiterribacter gracilis TaxID=2812848 RepID=A0A8S8XKN2_9PROT|nr:selenocysteine-specific translation factor [Rhodospirillales bacterium TMPK1]
MIVGTAGHVDHGKTSLVQALTGIDTDRLKEEKARGISIELGFAYLPATDGDVIGFIDVPGHERFVHTMLAGAGGIDFLLLVIAADDGVMPQTREHLAIVDLLGVRRGLVVVSKIDLVDATRRREVETEIANLLAPTALAGIDMLSVSTRTGAGLDALRARLVREATEATVRLADRRFRLSVDRCFTLAGAGTVVTGTVLSGQVAVGDQVLVSPSGKAARVRSLHAQNRAAERGVAGQRCALNLAGEEISKDAIARGDMVLDPTLHAPTDRIDAQFRLLPEESRDAVMWQPVRLHHAAVEVGARLVPLQGSTIAPGASGFVQLVTDQPIAAAAGDAFVLRDNSGQRTIGGGRFLDLRAPARKRRGDARLAQLDALAQHTPADIIAALLDAPPHLLDLTSFARDHALPVQAIDAIAAALDLSVLTIDGQSWAMTGAQAAQFRASMLDTLDRYHREHPDLQGIGLERLRLQLEPRLAAPLFKAALQREARGGAIALSGAWVRRAEHVVRLTPYDEELWHEIRPLLGDTARFRPPRVRDLSHTLDVAEEDVRRLCKLLSRLGQVDEIAHDHFFLRSTTAEMVEIVRDLATHAPDGQFVAAQFRDKVENGRKVAIEILEFFDRHGITLRRGEQRRINMHRMDLFGAAEQIHAMSPEALA